MASSTATAVAATPAQRTAALLSLAVPVTLVVIFLLVRLWRLDSVSLDGDEVFSLTVARFDWHGLWDAVVRDAIHPPLFYVLLKFWVAVGGESLYWLRLFPVVVSTLCLAPVFLLCKDLGVSRGARDLALLAGSVHPWAVYLAQHMRMYCLLGLFGLTSIWVFQRYLREPSRRNLVILSSMNLLAVYSHYYGWMIVGLQFLYLLWRGRRALPAFIASSLLVLALFCPWLWVAAQSVHAKGGLTENLGWISRPRFGELAWFYAELSGFTAFLTIASRLAVVVFAFLYFAYRRRSEPGFHWLIVVSLTPPLLAYLASQFLAHSVWGHRHLIFTLWPFLIVLADSIWGLRPLLRGIAVVLVAVWAWFAFAAYAPDDQKIHWDRLTMAMLDAEPGHADHVTVFTVDPYLHYSIWFPLDSLTHDRVKALGPYVTSRQDIPSLKAKAGQFAIQKADSLDEVHGTYFWVGYVSAPGSPKSLREPLEQRGCKTGQELIARNRVEIVTLFPVECPGTTINSKEPMAIRPMFTRSAQAVTAVARRKQATTRPVRSARIRRIAIC